MLLSDGMNDSGEEVFSSDVIFETREPVNAHTFKDNTFLPPRYGQFLSSVIISGKHK